MARIVLNEIYLSLNKWRISIGERKKSPKEKGPGAPPIHAQSSGAFAPSRRRKGRVDYTMANIFHRATCDVVDAVSYGRGNCGSPDTWRDPRGFRSRCKRRASLTCRHNTRSSLCANLPNQFSSFSGAEERRARQHNARPRMQWDFLTCARSAHQVTYPDGDRGNPQKRREMNAIPAYLFGLSTRR